MELFLWWMWPSWFRAPDCGSGDRGFESLHPPYFYAGMAELADALDLGSSAFRRMGSSPFTRTDNFFLIFLLC